MADNTKIWPIFRWANWGLSDDLFTGIRNSFYYSNNIEIREDAKSIYPKQSPRWIKIDLWARNTVWSVMATIYFNNTWYVFSQNNVYKIDVENRTATWIASWIWWLTGESLIDAELFNGSVYISTTKSLYRIDQGAADVTWGTESNFDYMELNSSWYHPLYATDIFLAVGNWTEVSKVTKEIPDQLQDWIKLQTDYDVKFINELWWFLRITATDWHYWNEILLWDKISETANEVIPMSWYTFLQSCVYNWYHYLLSNKWLWLVNWYQFYILKKTEDLDTSNRISNWMVVYDDKLYFVTTNWIFIYWAKNKNYNDVLNMWSSRTDDYWKPWALGTDWNYLVYTEWNRTSWSAHIYAYLYIKWREDWTNWEFQTMAYFWTSMSEIKQSMYLRVWYNLPSWDIRILYKTEASPDTWNDTDWTEVTPHWWLTKNKDMRSPFATTFKLNCRFQWIQFKFLLSWKNTKIYSADLYYNVMLD